jgi:hypothetical protein
MIVSVRSVVLTVSVAAFVLTPWQARAAKKPAEQTLPAPIQYFNPQTGETATIGPGQTAPAGFAPLQSPPPVAPPGSSVSFLPGQVPQLYANPANGQSQWVLSGSQPPSGWIKLIPAPSSPPIVPPSFAPPATSSTTPAANSPTAAPQIQTTKQSNTDYGAGGHSEQDTSTASGVLEGRVYDSSNNLRDDTTYQYTTYNGNQYMTGSTLWDFDPKGRLSFTLGLKYDFRGDLTSSDITHYGLHGERTSEEITDYHATDYEIRDWKIGAHGWSAEFNTYKLPTTTGASTLPQTPITPGNTGLGVLFPRDYHPGDTITGSLWPSSYADNFKTVPGLSEYDFSLPSYSLPDGSPEWCRFKIGVSGYGYSPVEANGTFSVHIPLDWKGPLILEATGGTPPPLYLPIPVRSVQSNIPVKILRSTQAASSSVAELIIDEPVPAPTLPSTTFPAQAQSNLDLYTKYHLIDLWDDADDLEDELDYEYSFTQPDWDYIDYLEDELDDVYDEIDYIHFAFPSTDVLRLAQGYLTDTSNYNSWLGNQPNLTTDQQTDLKNSIHFTNFLQNEIDYSNLLSSWGPSNPVLNPYWTNPILTQGKLNVLRGSFFGDPLDTHIRIDNFPLTPIAATPYNWYFMPPPGLTFGLHNEYIDSPLFGETVLPVFYMTLTMGAGQLQLHKGQSTTYFARLDIANGLPSTSNLFGGSPSYDTDLIGSSELAPIQQAAPASRTGFISFSVTNQSPGTIAMQNQFRILNASNFVPSGSYQVDGGITAIMDGGFSILGVARANLAPEGGIGSAPGKPSSPGSSAMSGWLPSFSLNFDPATLNNSPFMTNCSAPAISPPVVSPTSTTEASSAAPATPAPTTGTSNPPGCPSQALIDLYNDAAGNPPTSVPVGDNVDLTQLPEAAKRYDDAVKKREDAEKAVLTAYGKWADAWNNGIKSAPVDLLAELADAQHERELAEGKKKDLEAVNNSRPSDSNAAAVAAAEEDLAEKRRVEGVAKQKVIDSFTADDRRAYYDAKDALRQAGKDYKAAKEEERAASEALEKLQKAAGLK